MTKRQLVEYNVKVRGNGGISESDWRASHPREDSEEGDFGQVSSQERRGWRTGKASWPLGLSNVLSFYFLELHFPEEGTDPWSASL